ncbi:MAG: hypothetical protein ACHQUB_02385 [Candidatus Saccharimonadia bacterium]
MIVIILAGLGIVFGFKNISGALAVSVNSPNQIPNNERVSISAYDNPFNPASGCQPFNGNREYDTVPWVSLQSDATQDASPPVGYTVPTGTTSVPLQVNDMVFACWRISNQPPFGAVYPGLPRDTNVINRSLTQQIANVASVTADVGTISGLAPQYTPGSTITIPQNLPTSYWFGNQSIPFTWNAPSAFAPGSSVTVNITVQLVGANVFHGSQWQCLVPSGLITSSSNWMHDCITGSITFQMLFVTPGNNASCGVPVTSASIVTAGQSFTATVPIINNSSSNWPNSGVNQYRMANVSTDPAIHSFNITAPPAANPGPYSLPGNPQRFNLPAPVPIGATATITYTINAPATAGLHTYYFEMFQENGAGLVSPACPVNINVGIPISTPNVPHRIYAANVLSIIPQQLRDSFQFVTNLVAYMWPDAGLRSRGDNIRNLWLAGVWGYNAPGGADNGGGLSTNTDLNIMNLMNTGAEANCPAPNVPGDQRTCVDRLPLAYVPDLVVDTFPATVQTPNGNNWLSIRDGDLGTNGARGVADNTIHTTCGANAGFSNACGGFWSNLVGRYSCVHTPLDYQGRTTTSWPCPSIMYPGNYINNAEISNIHVGATNITSIDPTNTSWQGKLTNISNPQASVLQPDAHLAAGNVGQGPVSGGPANDGAGVLDNIKNVSSVSVVASAGESLNVASSPANPGAPVSLPNFIAPPFVSDPSDVQGTADITTVSSMVSGVQFGSLQAVSHLQDGLGNGYPSQTEELSYTGSIRSAAITLNWDEYVDWSQIDDKGHWATTRASGIVTGINEGAPATYVYTPQSLGGNTGTHLVSTGLPVGCGAPGHPACGQMSVCNVGPSSISVLSTTFNGLSYSPSDIESRFGWTNPNTIPAFVTNPNYNGTGISDFGPDPTTNSAWATTNPQLPMWQDPNMTTMDDSSSSYPLNPAALQHWTYNSTDSVYTNRNIYGGAVVPSFPTAYSMVAGGSGCGSVVFGPPQNLTYYPGATQIHEDGSTHADFGTNGLNPATGTCYDGACDDQVDIGWTWVSDLQRVHYQNSWKDHTRNLGNRAVAPDVGAVPTAECSSGFGSPNYDLYFLGIADTTSNCLRPGRAVGTIYNPTLSTQSQDVLGVAGISGYFNGSSAGSAFLYSQCGIISSFGSGGQYPLYYNNPASDTTYQNAATNLNPTCNAITSPTGNPAVDPIHHVFGGSFDSDILGIAAQSNIVSPPTNLNGKIYRTGSGATLQTGHDLIINSDPVFCNGSGTIVVEGNLYINSNISYCPGSANKSNTPSVGFIVNGNIIIGPAASPDTVNNIVGAYFATGQFQTLTTVIPGNFTTSDPVTAFNTNQSCTSVHAASLNVCGLIVADNFDLERQPSGVDLAAGSLPEQFIYDGRVVVNPPPGFNNILTASAVWNEGVPYTTP